MRREPVNDDSEYEDEGEDIELDSESASPADEPVPRYFVIAGHHSQRFRTLLPHWNSEMNLSSPALLDLLSETPISLPPTASASQPEQHPPSDDEFQDF